MNRGAGLVAPAARLAAHGLEGRCGVGLGEHRDLSGWGDHRYEIGRLATPGPTRSRPRPP